MSDKKKEGFSLMDVMSPYVMNGGWVYAVAGFLFSLLFAYGASKIAYGETSSYFVAILAFFFAPLYYTYYAVVSYTPVPQILGAARRFRR